MPKAIHRQLFSNIARITDGSFNNRNSNNRGSTLSGEATCFFFLSDYRYGGCATFTAHLLHSLNRREVFSIAKRFE
ncbi:MAG: hypothetical protein M3232_03370, partial [Thermoproteota archaeon]|nr:hypothetical protein [Thermoproteota archaeon]